MFSLLPVNTDLKKDRIELLFLKSGAKKISVSGGHLTGTQKASAPSEESMRNHRAWIVKCKFIKILELVGGLYSTYL